MKAKRQRGLHARDWPGPSADLHEDESGRAARREPHGDRYGQLADWFGVTAVGSGTADELVGGVVGLRAMHWWTWRLIQLVRRRRPPQR